MKKMILAAICISMATMSVFANNHNNVKAMHAKPKTHAHHEMAARPMMADHIIDMQVIKEMNLSEKKVQKIAALKQQRREEMKGQHKHSREQMKGVNNKYRHELQQIMGRKTYIQYVERVNDHLAASQMAYRRHRAEMQTAHHKMHQHRPQAMHRTKQIQHHKAMMQHKQAAPAKQS